MEITPRGFLESSVRRLYYTVFIPKTSGPIVFNDDELIIEFI